MKFCIQVSFIIDLVSIPIQELISLRFERPKNPNISVESLFFDDDQRKKPSCWRHSSLFAGLNMFSDMENGLVRYGHGFR